MRFSKITEKYLLNAGWHCGRQAINLYEEWEKKLKEEYRFCAVSRDILLEFGGLDIKAHGPGEGCAKTSVVVDPTRLEGEKDFVDDFAKILKVELFPIGVANRGVDYIVVDESGKTYYIGNDLQELGSNFDVALECLLRGLRAKTIWP